MPHVTMEYSANLETRSDIGALCRAARAALMKTGLFELGAVRVRAVRCDHCAIADEHPDNAFLAALIRIGAGRTLDERRQAGAAVHDALAAALAPLFDTPHFALSVDLVENDTGLSWKTNAMHARLRGKSG
ncbi:MAG: 5-carboxymethyl-2-hydroxymuconate isomerase [Phyllobacteriaceae bacterium]|nr:5-carboxymethyl-2-hydroxymuconate isomerase [Phyllobacteriaceae bacterium]